MLHLVISVNQLKVLSSENLRGSKVALTDRYYFIVWPLGILLEIQRVPCSTTPPDDTYPFVCTGPELFHVSLYGDYK
jgi:hypothetical protein